MLIYKIIAIIERKMTVANKLVTILIYFKLVVRDYFTKLFDAKMFLKYTGHNLNSCSTGLWGFMQCSQHFVTLS